MRLREIFTGHKCVFSEDGDAAVNIADQALVAAKRQKKTAELSKARDGVVKKQKELSGITASGK
jgi:hypothetical protein